MSTDSLPNPKPLAALVVVEGERTEMEFFELFGRRMGLNLKLHTVRCNVYTLFKWMAKDCGEEDLTRDDLVLDVPRLIAQHEKDEHERDLLRQHYDALYLVYDCDLQDSRVADKDAPPPIEARARANFAELRQMVRLLDDEYDVSVGKLYVNYPMFESCWDADSFADPTFQTRRVALDELPNDGYKHSVSGRLLHQAWRFRAKWKDEDFYDIVRMNVFKAADLLGVVGVGRIESEIESVLSQEAILRRQQESVEKSSTLAVLNTSVFLPIDQFGQKYPLFFARIMEPRTYPSLCFADDGRDARTHSDFVVFMRCERQHGERLCGVLRGILRVYDNVDIVIFPDEFCRDRPDYHDAPKSYDMSNVKAREPALKRLRSDPLVNWCCRKTLLGEGMQTVLEVAELAKGTIVFVR